MLYFCCIIIYYLFDKYIPCEWINIVYDIPHGSAIPSVTYCVCTIFEVHLILASLMKMLLRYC